MKTEIVKAEVRNGELDFPELRKAAECLAGGGIVAFPTETVYGLGVNLSITSAVRGLYNLKGRSASKPFTLHVSSESQVKDHVDEVPGRARRLMHRFWPGPLTIVFSADSGTVGIRVPSNRIACELIRESGADLGVPSANMSGEEPAWNAEQVSAVFDGRIDMIVDGGPSELRQPSTVVSVESNRVRMLREGIISAADIERTADTAMLFVCGGNSCRSPMAEAICRGLLAKFYAVSEDGLEDLGISISSAGTSAIDGGPPSDNALAALGNMNFRPPRGRSRRITPEIVNSATRVFTMTQSQRTRILDMVPEAASKVELLDPEGTNVQDPIGSPVSGYEMCAVRIRSFLEKRLETI